MLLTHTIRKSFNAILLGALTMSFASCSWMEQDLPPCDNIVRVHLVYDYNIQRADMFSDHVGEVRLFVIDDATNLVVRDTVVSNKLNANAIANHPASQTFHVDFTDLPVERTYRFQAYALQKPEAEAMASTGDKYHITSPAIGENINKLNVQLSHAATADADGRYDVVSPACGLDTLWMTRAQTEPLFVPDPGFKHQVLERTVSMIRDTKYLHVSLHHVDEERRTQMSDDMYRVEITDGNAHLLWDNSIADYDSNPLRYKVYDQRTTEGFTFNQATQAEELYDRTAHYDISFNRLMYYEGSEHLKNAQLHIISNEDDSEVAVFSLPQVLARGRDAFAIYNYANQEYLDREYDYTLHLYLKGDSWLYMELKVNIMAWSIRIQRNTL